MRPQANGQIFTVRVTRLEERGRVVHKAGVTGNSLEELLGQASSHSLQKGFKVGKAAGVAVWRLGFPEKIARRRYGSWDVVGRWK